MTSSLIVGRWRYVPYRGLENVVRVEGRPHSLFVRVEDGKFKELPPDGGLLVDAAIEFSMREMHNDRFAFRPARDAIARELALVRLILNHGKAARMAASPHAPLSGAAVDL